MVPVAAEVLEEAPAADIAVPADSAAVCTEVLALWADTMVTDLLHHPQWAAEAGTGVPTAEEAAVVP